MLDRTASAERRIAQSVNPVDLRAPMRPLETQVAGARRAGKRRALVRAAHFGLVGPVPAPAYTIEAPATSSARLPRRADDVFGTMLASVHPQLLDAGWTPRPLWSEEAMHRAYRLLELLQRLRIDRPDTEYDWQNEYGLAMQLTDDFRSLSAGPEYRLVPCSMVLRSVLRGLSALFGPAAGDIDLRRISSEFRFRPTAGARWCLRRPNS